MKTNSGLLRLRTAWRISVAFALGAACSVVTNGQDRAELGEEKQHNASIVLKKCLVKDADGNLVPGIEVAHDFGQWVHNDMLGSALYNPFFDGTLRPTGVAIWVFDSDGKYVGNLLATSFKDTRPARVQDFVDVNFISSNPRLGRRMAVPTSGRVSDDGVIVFPALKPGKYRIQVVGTERMRSNSPLHSKDLDKDVAHWLNRYKDNKVAFRSNVLEFEITAPEKGEEGN